MCIAITGGLNANCTGDHESLAIPQGVNQNGTAGLTADQMGDNKVPYANT